MRSRLLAFFTVRNCKLQGLDHVYRKNRLDQTQENLDNRDSSSDQRWAQGRRYTRERENLRQNLRELAYTGETPGRFEWFPV